MSETTNIITILAIGIPLFSVQPAMARTYLLPIDGAESIHKIVVDKGSAKFVGREGSTLLYELDVNPGECIVDLFINHEPSTPTKRVRYEVCTGRILARD